ncbi:ketopantoate reductase family protein [Streptacidiphilus monticola]|uniref:2-dehydropantoate 2-reductase n=1 Tax=Streptacidiphilus monticola TaxID=2161674 RepID=A0ABW1FU11_9ACTN
MRYVIIGAGAVGGTIGGRLAQAGREVVLVARGAHLEALRREGLRLVTPGGAETLRLPAVGGAAELGALLPGDVLVLAVKSQDTAAALTEWAALPGAQDTPVVCAQNGVSNERTALRLFPQVVAACVWLPATHLEPGVVVSHTAPLSGILTLGQYPGGVGAFTEQIASDLVAAGFDAPVAPDAMRWKYGKLLNNLGNALEALLGRDGLAGNEDLYLAVREEGERVLTAAGIDWATDEERMAVQADRMDVRPIPGYGRVGGSTWQSLSRGTGSVEADHLNGEIALLARLHGTVAPLNAQLQRLVRQFAAEGRAPGSLTAAGLRELPAQESGQAATR